MLGDDGLEFEDTERLWRKDRSLEENVNTILSALGDVLTPKALTMLTGGGQDRKQLFINPPMPQARHQCMPYHKALAEKHAHLLCGKRNGHLSVVLGRHRTHGHPICIHAHVLLYWAFNGPMPKGFLVMHGNCNFPCKNPRCLNKLHLHKGNHKVRAPYKDLQRPRVWKNKMQAKEKMKLME